MYLNYWGLSRHPFDDAPNPYFMFYSPEQERMLSGILSAFAQRRGVLVLTGETGCGKTIISRVLIQRLVSREKKDSIALMVNPALESVEFLGEWLQQFGLHSASRSREELLGEIGDQLSENGKNGGSTTLIIDEAQAMTADGFETLNAILDLGRSLNILMMGLPELSDAIHENRCLDERVAERYHIAPMDARDTVKYILFRLEKAEAVRPVFSAAAMDEIYRLSEGIPRKVNNICDLALVFGYERKADIIDKEMIAV